MAIARDHEIHARRLGRNVGVGVCLVAFVGIVFALSVVKITRGEAVEGFDHVPSQMSVGTEILDAPAPLPSGDG